MLVSLQQRMEDASMKRLQITFLILLTCFFYSGSASAYKELEKIKTDLATGPAPALPEVGSKLVSMQNGEEVIRTYTAKDENTLSAELSGGCKFTDPIFPNSLIELTPSLNWENCGGGTGKGKATVKAKGELFPLAKGNKIVFDVQGESSNGDKWKNQRSCKVKGKYRVNTLSGDHDTWKIVCKHKRFKQTIYYSPELGQSVVFDKKHYTNRKGSYIREYIRTE